MSNAVRRYSSEFDDPISVKINVVTENEVPLDVEPQIVYEYKRGEYIQTWNKEYFMTDLSNVEEIFTKINPETYGLTIFKNLTDITTTEINFSGDTGLSTTNIEVKSEHLISYIDKGENITFNGVREESENFANIPRSNTELYSFNTKSDIDVFDYPSYCIDGTRKIPSSSADTLCGEESTKANKSFYNWYFGENAGIDFNPIKTGGTAQAISGSVNTMEGVSSISDIEGNLLFYSDGSTIYTSGNTEMQNGTGLFGSSSSTQTCLVVPRPSTNKYYVFTTSTEKGLRFSEVDMDLQNGEGQVISKNNSLLLATEKVAATKHSNDTDYWVASHTTGTTSYSVIKVSSVGISTPVISNIGSTHNTAIGYLKFSPNSQKLACAIYDEDIIDIFDFDTSGGTLSNLITITGFTYVNGPYGLEFSEDSSKLYATDGASTKVYQFDLSYSSATDMTNYAIEVGDVTGASLGAAQMGPDNRIYVADLDEPYLHVIHDTNNLGVECSFKENYFVLSGASSGITSQWGLPNTVSNNYFSCDRDVYYTNISRTETFNFDAIFDNLSDVIENKNITTQFSLYKYDSNNGVFNISPVYTSEEIPSTGLTNDMYMLEVPFSAVTEGEFIFKSFYNRDINTLLSKQLGFTTTTRKDVLTGSSYGIYDSTNDWYFVNMYRADIPQLNNSAANPIETATVSGFNVKSVFTTSGSTNYSFSISNSESIGIVSYNGSVLSKDREYSANTTGDITLTNIEVLDNQLLTVVYVSTSTPGTSVFTDEFIVDSTINSGATNTQSITDRVFFNTDQNKYEFYLSAEPLTDNISLSLNGGVLANDVEYYRSATNTKRVILDGEIRDGDIIQSLYLPKTGLLGTIDTVTPIFSWNIANAPLVDTSSSGVFTLEVVDNLDTTFDTILYSSNVDYINDVNNYLTQINLSGATSGDMFRYRVKNEKKYQPISGETITDILYSDVNTFQLVSNAGKSY
jgi:hypothetical protein